MAIIYRKTADGVHEIETRARRLSPRVRAALILVDGRRSVDELGALVQQCDEMLKTLMAAGLIEMVRAPARVDAAVTSPATPVATPPSFDTLRRESVRAINDLLGPLADPLALRIERADDAAHLRAALERALASIATARGGAAAAQFAARFLNNGSN